MRLEIFEFIGFMVIALIVGGMVGAGIVDLNHNKSITELGGAICDQQYNLEFDNYDDKVLKCKKPDEKEKYDGIEIELGDIKFTKQRIK